MNVLETTRYLRRIGVDGPIEVTLDGLAALQRAHLLAVPFENLDIVRGVPVGLDRRANFEKVVERGRGGYCYELNGLFSDLLISLGFDVRLLSARVATRNGGFGPPYDHLMLQVNLSAQPYLVDVGFGDSFAAPLILQSGVEQLDRDARYMVLRLDGEWALCRTGSGSWDTMLLFSLTSRKLADFEGRSLWTQNSADSHFVKKVICTRMTEDGRKTLSGDRMIVTRGGRKFETIVAPDDEQTARLAEDFGVVLS